MPTAPKTFRPAGYEQQQRAKQQLHGQDEYRRFIKTATWQKFRETMKHILPMICAVCGTHEQRMILDHKIPVTGPNDPSVLDPEAVQWLCQPCHNRKTMDDKRKGLTR